MSALQYTLPDYQSLLNYSQERHLLVEGGDDRRAFALFLDELAEQTETRGVEPVCIDSAEDLIEFEGAGNRGKVEIVCSAASAAPYAERLVGFVDREFRGFGRDPGLVDRIEGHRVSDRLIWSRGHSVENYYFDFPTLRSPLREFSVTHHVHDALSLFEALFEKTIRLACAASLAGDEMDMLRLVKGSVSQDIFDICAVGEARVSLGSEAWESTLTGPLGSCSEIAHQMIERFGFWRKRVEAADFHVVRWMCHGHIGLAFIWAVYSRCVLEVCRLQGYDGEDAQCEARRVLKAEESVRFNACAERWVQRSLGNQCTYPIQVFRLLGLDLPGAH
ncbi:MAG: hypothetical protein ACOC6F_00535 [bacterium]